MEAVNISGILKHFLHFLKGLGQGLGPGHKLIDLFLNQERAIKIFLARSVGK